MIRPGERRIAVTFRVIEDDGQYTGYCDELGVASCGDTVDEAMRNILDAVLVHLHGLSDIGEIDRFLATRGITILEGTDEPSGPTSVDIPIGQFVGRQLIPV